MFNFRYFAVPLDKPTFDITEVILDIEFDETMGQYSTDQEISAKGILKRYDPAVKV